MWTYFLGNITTLKDEWHEIVSLPVPFASLEIKNYIDSKKYSSQCLEMGQKNQFQLSSMFIF